MDLTTTKEEDIMQSFLNRCNPKGTSHSSQNQSISTVPIFRTHTKAEVREDFGASIDDIRALFKRIVAKQRLKEQMEYNNQK